MPAERSLDIDTPDDVARLRSIIDNARLASPATASPQR
jgi:hypothetical protein